MSLVEDFDTRLTLTVTRVFDAPRELVWAAWTRPEMRVLWLGPPECAAIKTTSDLRIGGAWSAQLHSPTNPNGLWQGGVYREIQEPERLVFTFAWDETFEGAPPVETVVTVVLTALPDGRTRMAFTHAGVKSKESLLRQQHGWTGTFDRLDAWIATQT